MHNWHTPLHTQVLRITKILLIQTISQLYVYFYVNLHNIIISNCKLIWSQITKRFEVSYCDQKF